MESFQLHLYNELCETKHLAFLFRDAKSKWTILEIFLLNEYRKATSTLKTQQKKTPFQTIS